MARTLSDDHVDAFAKRIAALLRHLAPSGNHILADEIAALRAEITPKLARIERVIDELLVKRPSRAQQAKKLGVSRSTLWRREKLARLRQLANGSVP